MNQKLKIFTKIAALSLVFSLVLFTGCSDNNPYYPESNQVTTLNASALSAVPLQTAEPVISDNSGMISAEEGGTIVIDRDKYEHEFVVEPKALDEDAEIRIVSYKDKIRDKMAIVFECSPSGLVFKLPAKLEFDMSEIDSKAGTAHLLYFDSRREEWVLQSTKEVVKKSVVFEIDHFSKYAISD
jgi:hypothetical protein